MHVREGLTSEGAWSSDLHKYPFYKGVWNKSKLVNFGFSKNPYDAPSGMPYNKGDKGYSDYKTRSKITKTMDLILTSLRRPDILDNNHKQKVSSPTI